MEIKDSLASGGKGVKHKRIDQSDLDHDAFVKWTQAQEGSVTFATLMLLEEAFRSGLQIGRDERKKAAKATGEA